MEKNKLSYAVYRSLPGPSISLDLTASVFEYISISEAFFLSALVTHSEMQHF